jgi:hypothetical protein
LGRHEICPSRAHARAAACFARERRTRLLLVFLLATAFLGFIVFMRLRGRPSLKWVFAAAGFFWLSFLYGLGIIDYATRSGFPAH